MCEILEWDPGRRRRRGTTKYMVTENRAGFEKGWESTTGEKGRRTRNYAEKYMKRYDNEKKVGLSNTP